MWARKLLFDKLCRARKDWKGVLVVYRTGSDLCNSIGVFLGGIGDLVAIHEEAVSSVGDWLDQGGVLWMFWIVYNHNVVCKM